MNVFPIAPAESRYFWLLIPITLVLIMVMTIATVALRGAHASRFEIGPAALKLKGDLYGRIIPMSQLRVEQARRVDFVNQPELRPHSRRAGTALPGYQAGWFRLKNGEKALLYLTDRSKAVYLPTSNGYSLLLSPTDPDGFLNALRNTAR